MALYPKTFLSGSNPANLALILRRSPFLDPLIFFQGRSAALQTYRKDLNLGSSLNWLDSFS